VPISSTGDQLAEVVERVSALDEELGLRLGDLLFDVMSAAEEGRPVIGVPGDLRTVRKLRGWSQAGLAARLDVSQATVCRWETGNGTPRPLRMIQLAQLLGVDERSILGMTVVG
jgi:DNA-binding XRE family transcriptional regulator